MAKAKETAAAEDMNSTITNFVRASYPILWVQTAEEARAEKEILGVAQAVKRNLVVWSSTEGFLKLGSNEKEEIEDPIEALQYAKKGENKTIYVFRDLHMFFNTAQVLRLLRDIARDFKQGGKTLIIISPLRDIPPELERDITLIEFKLPDKDMVGKIFDTLYKSNKAVIEKDGSKIGEDERELIIQAALGLTTNEVENAISKAIVDRAKMNGDKGKPSISKLVMKEKAQAVRKTGRGRHWWAGEPQALDGHPQERLHA
jgi:hypothetical protein